MKCIRKIQTRKVRKADWKYFNVWWKNSASSDSSNEINQKHLTDKWLLGSFTRMIGDPKRLDYIVSNEKGVVIGHFNLILYKNYVQFDIKIGEEKYRNKGYGTLMTKKAIQIVFRKLKYKKLILEVKIENVRAIRVYEKCGFKIVKKSKDGKFYKMAKLR